MCPQSADASVCAWQQSGRHLGPVSCFWVRFHISMHPQRAPAAPLLIMMSVCSGLQGRTAQRVQAAKHLANLARVSRNQKEIVAVSDFGL